jgi:hypothetical protein
MSVIESTVSGTASARREQVQISLKHDSEQERPTPLFEAGYQSSSIRHERTMGPDQTQRVFAGKETIYHGIGASNDIYTMRR